MLDIIKTERKTGEEQFLNAGSATLLDYWTWAHSDIIGNAERGKLAEYIVAMALGLQTGTRTEWDSYDLLSKDNIKIEVKSSGYIQSWAQKTHSTISFGIQPTKALDVETNEYSKEIKRQADLYVFCVHNHKDQDTVNPLDLNQWQFYVLNTKVLNEKATHQKSIQLSSIKKLGAVHTDYNNLNQTINNVYHE